MGGGLFFVLLTGLTWTAIGIVLNRCARNDFDAAAYGILQGVLAALLCFVFYAKPGYTAPLALTAIVLFAAGINAFAQYFVSVAMRKGPAEAVWSISQTAMIFPFLAGLIFFDGKASAANWAGLGLSCLGIFVPAFGNFRNVRQWFFIALAALLCYGTLQTLYLLPSHLKAAADPNTMRPVLVCLGNALGWSLVSAVRRKGPVFSRKAVIAALAMACIHACGVRTFFLAIDGLSAVHRSGLAMPLMLGVNLAGFSLYSLLILKEKRNPAGILQFLLILAGLVMLALP